MENQIEKFDPSKLMDGVRDRIKATFVSLIPDDAWNSMVEKELYVFTTGKILQHHEYQGTDSNGNAYYRDWEERIPYDQKPITDNYGNVAKGAGDNISPLQKMIRDELREKFKEDLQKYLHGEEYQSAFDHYGAPAISKAVEEILVKNTDTVFQHFMATMMQQAFISMRESIRTQIASGFNSY